MGKRGGKRRNRASKWEEQSSNNNEEHCSKKPKVVETSTHSTSNASLDRLEVSLVGVEELSPLPAPFSLETATEKVQEISDMNANETPSPQETLIKIWNYLGHNQWKPSKIQQHLWALLLESNWNIVGVAPTGSGKTFSYAIPTILSNSGILVLVPTRELVQQVAKVFVKVSKAYSSMNISQIPIVCIHGGASRVRQQHELEAAATTGRAVVVATPGRFLDLTRDTRLLPILSWIVLDEADQLAKDGDLGPQVNQILEVTKRDTTRLVLVSATYPERNKETFQTWVGKEHVLVQVDNVEQSLTKEETDASTHKNAGMYSKIPSHLEQILHVCAEHKKPRKLLHTLQQIYKSHPNQRSRPLGIVFFSKIEKLKHVSTFLEKEGVTGSVELHSQLASSKLQESHLSQFACGRQPLLLATDVAARGIDIPNVQFVIQYDFPGNLQQYIHRCGRAGRSQETQKPTIYSFFTRNLKAMAPDLIRLLESNDAWVDPNLRQLSNNDVTKAKKPRMEKIPKNNQDDESDVDDFPELAANRIVLKRASHVSDASSSSSSDKEDESDEKEH